MNCRTTLTLRCILVAVETLPAWRKSTLILILMMATGDSIGIFLFNVTASWNSTAGDLYYLLLQGDGAYSIKVEGASAFKPTLTP
jgi:hypothetical protein